MFRLAEDKEIKCLLKSLGAEHTPEPPLAASVEESDKYRKRLMEQVRASLLQSALKYIPHQLKLDSSMIPEVERVTGMKFKCVCMSCSDCESICLNFAEVWKGS
jgi:hypothetical protein